MSSSTPWARTPHGGETRDLRGVRQPVHDNLAALLKTGEPNSRHLRSPRPAYSATAPRRTPHQTASASTRPRPRSRAAATHRSVRPAGRRECGIAAPRQRPRDGINLRAALRRRNAAPSALLSSGSGRSAPLRLPSPRHRRTVTLAPLRLGRRLRRRGGRASGGACLAPCCRATCLRSALVPCRATCVA